jgi:cholesterol transport system auxiliary component
MALAVAQAGCISLLPKEKPVQLYRFGAQVTDPAAAPPAAGATFTVRLAPIGFDRPASTDRILTVHGDQTAYVADARWITPASALFGEAVTRAFDARGGPARLLAFGEPSPADLALKIDVRAFEVRYGRGMGGDPEVVVEAYGALIDFKTPSASRSRLFEGRARAESNSIHAIVQAFDKAVARVLAAMIDWVDAKGGA